MFLSSKALKLSTTTIRYNNNTFGRVGEEKICIQKGAEKPAPLLVDCYDC